jgi:excisionase family DNA binding protein
MSTTAVPAELAADRFLTVHEVAAAAGVSRATIYAEMNAGRIASVKVRYNRRIPLSSARAYLAGLSGSQETV